MHMHMHMHLDMHMHIHMADLMHIHNREAQAEELLLRLEVPTLFGHHLTAIADTLAARVLAEGDVSYLRLPGYGMPR